MLVKAGHGTMLGSMANAFVAIAVFGVLWIATLPLWLTGIGAVVLPALISAYLNQRLFRYDALAEYASGDEYVAIVRRAKGRLYALGLLLALAVLHALRESHRASACRACLHAPVSLRARAAARQRPTYAEVAASGREPKEERLRRETWLSVRSTGDRPAVAKPRFPGWVYIRSNTAAMPCPPPMHIVTSA